MAIEPRFPDKTVALACVFVTWTILQPSDPISDARDIATRQFRPGYCDFCHGQETLRWRDKGRANWQGLSRNDALEKVFCAAFEWICVAMSSRGCQNRNRSEVLRASYSVTLPVV